MSIPALDWLSFGVPDCQSSCIYDLVQDVSLTETEANDSPFSRLRYLGRTCVLAPFLWLSSVWPGLHTRHYLWLFLVPPLGCYHTPSTQMVSCLLCSPGEPGGCSHAIDQKDETKTEQDATQSPCSPTLFLANPKTLNGFVILYLLLPPIDGALPPSVSEWWALLQYFSLIFIYLHYTWEEIP